ncbi:DUF1097 domain-containing protein [Parageobacillus thermoglucosidasius]|uniref:DUF1097 domain-containing protein n=1 Tax=Parageobacillus thermoglucosidasius TaxID=1426 RepID=A0AB38R3S9_PARTM|nr:DUF1097 domain-containing protein [Parageobacillus thermoglucosidasius]UOE77708.1 DUF1097 domain-containing protein [Parageobacillus thermoglucosidasius]
MSSVLATGLLCGLWALLAPSLGLMTWAGFAGCTTFFAVGTGGVKGMVKAMLCNITGVGCGMLILWLSAMLEIPYSAAIFSGIITVVMCLAGKLPLINYTPGIFIGCFSTFAANGDWQVLLLSLLSGAVLGFLCVKLSEEFSCWYQKLSAKQRSLT